MIDKISAFLNTAAGRIALGFVAGLVVGFLAGVAL